MKYLKLYESFTNEQEKGYLPSKTAFTTETQRKIYLLFLEYITDKFNINVQTKYSDAVKGIKSGYLDTDQRDDSLKDAIGFFKSKGYKQPDNRDIKEYQKAFNIGTFKTKDGKEANFVDGTFGIATVKASLQYVVRNWSLVAKSNKEGFTFGDNKQRTAERSREMEIKGVAKRSEREGIKGKETQEIGTGTQKIN